MKVLKLKLEGFTCYQQPVEIDFSDLELFAITGPTGSGKSSIIDAIIFALYGKVPRVSTDVTTLISQGQEQMNVLLEFCIGESNYRVARKVQHKKGTQVILDIQDSSGEWKSLSSGVRQSNQEIMEIIGLDYEAFIRCIILPQGAFERFLHDAKSRQDILTRLLNLEVLGDMQKDASRRFEKIKGHNQTIRVRLENEFAEISQEKLQEDKQSLSQLEQKIAHLSHDQEKLQKKHNELQEIVKLNQAKEQALQEKEQLQPQLTKMANLQKSIHKAQRILPLKPSLEQLAKQEKQSAKLQQSKEKVEGDLAKLQAEFENKQQQLQERQEEHQKLEELEEQIQRLQRAIYKQQQLQQHREEWQQLSQRQSQEQKHYQQRQDELAELQQQLKAKQEQQAKQQQQQQQLEQELKELEKYWKLQSVVEVLQEKKQAYLEREKNCQQWQEKKHQQQQQLNKIAGRFQQQQQQWETQQQKLQELGDKQQLQEQLLASEQVQHFQEQIRLVESEQQQECERLEQDQQRQQQVQKALQKAQQREQELAEQMDKLGREYEIQKQVADEVNFLVQEEKVIEQKLKDLAPVIEEKEQQKQAKQKERRKLQDFLKQSEKQKQQQEQLLKQQREQWREVYTHNLANSLRSHLHPGEDCPVCLQQVKSPPKSDPGKEQELTEQEAAIAQEEEQLATLAEKITEAQTQKEHNQQLLDKLTQELKEHKKEQKQLNKGLEQLKDKRPVESQDKEWPKFVKEVHKKLQEIPAAKEKLAAEFSENHGWLREQQSLAKTLEEREQERKATLEQKLQRLQELREELNKIANWQQIAETSPAEIKKNLESITKLEQQLAEQQQQLKALEEEKKQEENLLRNLTHDYQSAQKERDKAKQSWQQKREQVQEQLQLSEQQDLEETLQQKITSFEQKSQQWNQLSTTKQELASEVGQLEVKQAEKKSRIEQYQQTLAEREEKIQKIRNQAEKLREEIVEITGHHEPAKLKEQLQKQHKEIQSNYQQAREQYLLWEQKLQKQTEEAEKIQQQAEEIQQELDSFRQEIAHEAEQMGFGSLEEIRQAVVDPEELANWEEQVRTIQSKEREIQSRLDYYQKQLAGRQARAEDVKECQQRLERLRQEFAELTEQRGALANKIEESQHKLKEAATLQEKLDQNVQQESVLKQLTWDLRANRFPTFVLDHALQTLAEDGSLQLDLLSSGRYVFSLQQREFYVIDRWNDEESRPCKTLSGGETFLASLSLALALAERIYQLGHRMGSNCTLESLFLDEGFGSLDEDHLDVVVKALNNLQGTGRTIGIISHLSVLNNYLPVRLHVHKSREGSTVTRQSAL